MLSSFSGIITQTQIDSVPEFLRSIFDKDNGVTAVISLVVALLSGIEALRRSLGPGSEQAAKRFAELKSEPTRRLSTHFTDLIKWINQPVSLPQFSTEIQDQYWKRLLYDSPIFDEANRRGARNRAKYRMNELRTEVEILEELEKESSTPANNPIYGQTLREAAAERLATPEVQQHTEHTLKEFAPLLELNPRAMKRFINAYGMTRTVDLLSGKEIADPTQLALWTIVRLRWPTLAEYLEQNPRIVKYIGENVNLDIVSVPKDLQNLFHDRNVCDIIKGKYMGSYIDEITIRKMKGLQVLDSQVPNEINNKPDLTKPK
jgi:hypothetical protein